MYLKNITIIRPDWNTQAFIMLYDRRYILVSYNTAICCVQHTNGDLIIDFNPSYQQSLTTSKHFRWFMDTIPWYMATAMREFPKRAPKSTREFMDSFGIRTVIKL